MARILGYEDILVHVVLGVFLCNSGFNWLCYTHVLHEVDKLVTILKYD